MAVVVTKNPSGLKLKYDCGKNPDTGKSIVRSKTYSNISPDAVDQSLLDVANALASLQDYALLDVARADNKTLSE